MFKKYAMIAVFVLLLVPGLLAGCGGGAKKGEAPGPSDTQASSKKASSQASGIEELAQHKGADREAKLKEGAAKEGKLVLYGAMPVERLTKITGAFEKKYGVPAEVWRGPAEEVSRKAILEAQGKRNEVDVLEITNVELEKVAREKLLGKYWSPYFADYPESSRSEYWQAYRFNYIVPAYNTKLVTENELPKTYEDLLNPRWKGRLGIESKSWDWMATIVKNWGQGEEKGMAYFRQLAGQDVTNRKGKSLMTESVAAGEVPLALTNYSYKPQQMKKDGAPVDWFNLEPVVADASSVSLAKSAPHPNAALLFIDFLLSPEGENIVRDLGFVPANPKVEVDPPRLSKGFKYIVLDNKAVIDESKKWQGLFEDLFLKKQQ